MRWPLFLIPVLAGVLAWALLGGRSETELTEAPPAGTSRPPSVAPAPLPAPRSPEPSPALPPPVEPEPIDPEWITRILELPDGEGPLSGQVLMAAVARGGELTFAGATDADLEALKQVQIPHVDRSVQQPYAAMLGWLKEAGLLVERVGSTLVVRRRPDPDSGER